MNHTIFIYGTLKRGERNANLLDQADFLGDAVTRDPTYQMKAVNDPECDYTYPAVFKNGHAQIKGEIYCVDDKTLRAIDEIELEGTDYTRTLIPLENGSDAWMFLFINHALPVHDTHPQISYSSESDIYEWL